MFVETQCITHLTCMVTASVYISEKPTIDNLTLSYPRDNSLKTSLKLSTPIIFNSSNIFSIKFIWGITAISKPNFLPSSNLFSISWTPLISPVRPISPITKFLEFTGIS